jgi:CRISPR-associated protein Csm5
MERSKSMTVYQVTLKTLSPLHIGDGDELKQDFDFVARNGRTYRINEDALLMAKESQLRPDRAGKYPPPGALISDADLENGDFFRYSLKGIPRSAKTDSRVKSFIKDIYDRPYIPGSSLKGALRTALAWTGWKETNVSVNDITGRSRAWAGQSLERKMFGANPNMDILRALHVSDLFGPQSAGGRLMLVNAQVLTKKSSGSPIELEAVAGDTAFTGTIKIDDALFSPMAEPILHFSNRKRWLDELMKRAQAHSAARIKELADWFESSSENYHAVAKFYRQLADAGIAENQALVQIGWGSGWDGKTFWSHLQQDENRFERIVQDYRLHKAARNSPMRKPGDPFPRSKRAAMIVKDKVAIAAAPFGWALLEMG